ncbi:MAG TPA: type VI secretion system baseplate subunit TssF [Thermoanaerobaculia bacterium]|nr:type VI secretion system baseplate subunit TssF [Thermoanaerobaculia bacterium]
MPAPDADLLRCYLEELSYLRGMGERFAARYPKVARRLELQADECPDPHVERLIESFAFLTARIQSDLDNDFPEIANALLDVLYPQYLQSTPSMTIVRFDAKPKNTTGATIARGTPLFVTTAEGDVCRFRTSYATTIYPISVVDAQFVEASDYRFRTQSRAASVLRVTLQSQGEPFEVLGVDTLRFYLRGEMVVNRLYSMLFEGAPEKAVVVPRGSTDVPAPPYLRVTPVGFADDESVIHENVDDDRTRRTNSATHPPVAPHPAYRLLQEYFAFEEKFHFFDVHGLQHAKGTEIDLLFLLDSEARGRMHVGAESFVLGCTPAVNLFKKTSEPIRVDHRRTEYRIVADHRRSSAEIHSIRSVSGSSDAGVKSRQFAPYYSYTHAMAQENQRAYWHARRDEGGDTYLSFHDAAFDASLPADEVVFAHLWCTNGTLAAELTANYPMQTDEVLPVTQIVNLRKPTLPVAAPARGESLWRLVSHLSLSYLSLGGDEAAAALREILLLYCGEESRAHRQRIDSILSVQSDKIVRRVPGTSANGFCRGTRVKVEFADYLFASDAARLFGTVLSHFFGLHASINSFTQLEVRRAGTERNVTLEPGKGQQWPLMPGSRAVL